MSSFVHVQVDGNVGVIRLDRPPVNAINSVVHGELLEAADEVVGRTDIRAVVLYGGERSFAAGADIKEMAHLGPSEIAVFGKTLTMAIDAVARLPQPVVAAVTGYALGGGCELALAADFRIIAEDARIGLPEITLGVIPGAGGTQRLPRLVGVTKAKELIFTGRAISGTEAVAVGLASMAVPRDQVLPEAMKLARQLAGGATAALAAAKKAIADGVEMDLASGLQLEAAAFAELFATADQKTGMASFLQHGPGKAVFSGR